MKDERREFFRIQDEGIIHVEQIDEKKIIEYKKDILEQYSGEEDIFKRFFKFEADLQSVLFNNKTLSSEWLHIVELLNVKINQLARLVASNHETLFNQAPQLINLSANGLGWEGPKELTLGECVKVELVLMPQYTYLAALGRVVHCEKKLPEHSKYVLGLEFEVIRPQDTDRLIQHIMKKESEWLKSRRQHSLNNNDTLLKK